MCCSTRVMMVFVQMAGQWHSGDGQLPWPAVLLLLDLDQPVSFPSSSSCFSFFCLPSLVFFFNFPSSSSYPVLLLWPLPLLVLSLLLLCLPIAQSRLVLHASAPFAQPVESLNLMRTMMRLGSIIFSRPQSKHSKVALIALG